MRKITKKSMKGRRRRTDSYKRSGNRYVLPADAEIDYKNVAVLQKFLTDRGKIVSRRISGISAKKQRQMTLAIKIARHLALLTTGGTQN